MLISDQSAVDNGVRLHVASRVVAGDISPFCDLMCRAGVGSESGALDRLGGGHGVLSGRDMKMRIGEEKRKR